jgi:LmbE family N-acetylglucosaminyl deacetylase
MHPGAVVVTVFAGRPATYGPLTRWDAASGFRAGDDPVGVRRAEDGAALALLDATPVWLDFCDGQYGPSPSVDALATALAPAIDGARPTAVVVPLGLFHRDHALAHDAAVAIARARPALGWLAYEDAIYRRIPGLVDRRLEELRAAGLAPRRLDLPVAAGAPRKRAAIAHYGSQLRALAAPGHPGWTDALEPDVYWRLSP